MKKGIGLLLCTPHVEERHLPMLAAFAEMGYDGVEIPVTGGDAAHYRWLGDEVRKLGLECTAVGFLTAEEDPASADPAVRARAVARVGELAERAAILGADILAGPIHEAYAHFPGPITPEELARAADSLAAGADRAAPHGVSLMIEPLNRFESRLANTIEQAAALVESATRSNLGVVFDTHHAHLEADDLCASVAAVGSHIGHVQLSENHRGVPGSGQINFQEVCASLKVENFDGWLVIEAFSRIDPELGDLLHVWRDLAADWQRVGKEGLRVIEEAWGSA